MPSRWPFSKGGTLNFMFNSSGQDSKGVKVPDVIIIEYTYLFSSCWKPILGSKQFIEKVICLSLVFSMNNLYESINYLSFDNNFDLQNN